jgi:hypothetical protein
MRRIRIGAGRFALLVILCAGSIMATDALAQSETGSAPGKPLQLVQSTNKPTKVASTKSTKTAVKTKVRHHRMFAQRKRAPAPVQIAQETTDGTTDAWSAAPVLPFPDAASVTPKAPPAAEPAPSELVVAGQSVQIRPPGQINEIDLAAKADAALADAASPSRTADRTDMAAKPDLASTAAPASKIGSTAWLLQVLAALGGAVAAGSAAWFLIGSAPQRMYG